MVIDVALRLDLCSEYSESVLSVINDEKVS
jgi:hypothetical protein